MFSAARNSPHTAGLSHWRICIFCFIEFWELWLLWLHLRCDWESVPRVKVRFHRACGIFPALGWSKEWARNTIYKPGITLLIFIWSVDLWKHWVENVQSGFHRQIQPSSSYCTCHVIHESTDEPRGPQLPPQSTGMAKNLTTRLHYYQGLSGNIAIC